MKTYAPKGLHGGQLRALLADLGASPLQAAKFLQVTERTVWRWLKEENAPFAVLACLWHETPDGRHVTALDVGNELQIYAGLARCHEANAQAVQAQLGRVLAISDTGAANDPLMSGPPSTFVFLQPVYPVVRFAGTAGSLFGLGDGAGQVGPDGGVHGGAAAQDG